MTQTRLTLRVKPRARENSILGFDELGRLRVRVTAAPSGGAANKAVIKLLAEALQLSVNQVALERGHTSRTKTVEVRGMESDEVRRALSHLGA